MRFSVLLCVISGLFLNNISYASSEKLSQGIQVGRYLSVSNEIRKSQSDLLSQTIQIHFPHSVQTIGSALNYILRFSGYDLVGSDHMSAELKITTSKTLPVIDRELGPISLRKALLTLVGPAFYLTQNPIERTVDFHLKPEFAYLKHKHL